MTGLTYSAFVWSRSDTARKAKVRPDVNLRTACSVYMETPVACRWDSRGIWTFVEDVEDIVGWFETRHYVNQTELKAW